MMTFEHNLEKRISSELANALPFCGKELLTSVETLVNKGRKFRASLFYNASKCFGYEDEDNLLTIASALEMLHRSSLIHDDLVDQCPTRRGIKTLHLQYGNTEAVYIPNLLRDHVEEMLASYPLIQKDLMKVYNQICRGQLSEAEISKLDNVSWKDYERIIELKSAGFGRFALNTAYFLAYGKVDEVNPKKISKTGAMLFQIIDDIEDLLDPFKRISIDISNGIKIAPWFFLDSKQKTKLHSFEDVQKALSNSAVLKRTYGAARGYLNKLNKQIIAWLPNNEHRNNILSEIVSRFDERLGSYYTLFWGKNGKN